MADDVRALTPAALGIGRLFEVAREAVIVADVASGRIVLWNPAAERMFGYAPAEVVGQPIEVIIPEPLRAAHRAGFARYRATGRGAVIDSDATLDVPARRNGGEEFFVELSLNPLDDAPTGGRYVLALVRDVTARKQAEDLDQRQRRLLELIAAGAPLGDVLTEIVRVVEARSPDVLGSVLLLEGGARLRHGAGPSLPDDYNRAIDGIAIGPSVGSCGTAAYRREPVIVTDIAGDPLWADFRDLALAHGLRACWSTPVLAADGEVLGTVALYFREPRAPGEADRRLIAFATHLAGIAIERDRAARLRAEDTQRFLAEASDVLGSSLDYATTLASVARLAVPRVADWCAVDLLGEDGQLRRVAVEHVDPRKVALARELQQRYPPDADTGVQQVLRSGRSLFVPRISAGTVEASARDPEHRALLRSLGLRSAMTVPLIARGRGLGAITFIRAESPRPFDEADLQLAEDLAHRSAMAIDNARLYRDLEDQLAVHVQLNAELRRVAEARDAALAQTREVQARLVAVNADLARQSSALAVANRELEAFSYSVSHDLRAPLRAIDGFSRILLEDCADQLSADGQRYLRVIVDNARQMGQLIDDLLAFSRLSRQALNRQPASPAALARQALETLQPELDGRQVELAIADVPEADADPTQLRQVMSNLLANALKFTRRRAVARIEVGALEQDGETVYFVKDNGVGFDMRYADKLFGVFQRLHRAEDYEGTGVGLAIVQRVVLRHGGRVWAEAAPDEGATFFFTLAPKREGERAS